MVCRKRTLLKTAQQQGNDRSPTLKVAATKDHSLRGIGKLVNVMKKVAANICFKAIGVK